MTAYDITHGVGGLWEVHQWNGGVELNVQDALDDDSNLIRDRIVVTKITGLHSLPERPDPRSPKVARIGENPYPRSVNGVTVTYEGELRATTVPLLRSQRTALLAAFADTDTGYMDVIPHADVGGPTVRYHAEVLQLDIDDEITNLLGLFKRGFLLGVRLSDPRKYFTSLAVSETDTASVSVENVGDAPADPVVTVAGASGAVTLSDGTHTLTFTGVPSGSLIVDFAARTAKVGAVNCELVVASSDWWDPFVKGIVGGATVTVTQTGGTGITVAFTPSTWG